MANYFKSSITKTNKVTLPKANITGRSGFHTGLPHTTAPRIKPIKTRVYTKDVLREDPSKFTDIGFGQTGLTGES